MQLLISLEQTVVTVFLVQHWLYGQLVVDLYLQSLFQVFVQMLCYYHKFFYIRCNYIFFQHRFQPIEESIYLNFIKNSCMI